MRFVLGFVLGLVVGYCIVLFSWIAYTNLVDFHDFEGAAAMQVTFFFAPLGGILAGMVLGIWWQKHQR